MKYQLICFIVLLLISCKDNPEKETEPSPEVVTTAIKNDTAIIAIENPSAGNSQLPRLFSNGKNIYFSWVTRKDSTDQLFYSVFDGKNWELPNLIAQGNDWFTNWADFPAIAYNNGSVLTNHLQKSASDTYAYDIQLNLRSGQSVTKKNFILHNDGTKSEHGFVSMLPYKENRFFVTWLDGRHTTGDSKEHNSHSAGGAMTLRSAIVDPTGKITNRTELDDRVCDCCQTSAAMTSNGPVVVYRDRSDDEIRDISIVRNVNGTWTAPQTIGEDNWKIAGCPVNGPSVDAIGNTLAVGWFTVSNGEGDVKVAFSEDSGETFTRAYRIDAGSATGRVDVVMLNEAKKEAAIVWMQPNSEEELIYVMKINHHGYTGKPIVLTQSSAERASGFPQVEKLGEHLYFAWTSVTEDQKHIKTAKLLISNL